MQKEEASRMLNPSFRAAVSWAGWSDIDEKAELHWKISFYFDREHYLNAHLISG